MSERKRKSSGKRETQDRREEDRDDDAPRAAAEDDAPKGKTSKFTPQWVAAFSGLGVAVISALVSYGVTTLQVNADKERTVLEARLEEAKIFQSLLERATKSDDPAFVVLALSKVFPGDEKLIVTTAMMNPNLSTASTLNAIGADKNLDQYLDTIKGIIVNASADRRRNFNEIYGGKFPEFVMEVNYEVAVRSNGDDAAIGDLIGAMTDQAALVPSLRSKIAADPRVASNARLRARLARMLYQIDPSLMSELLDEATNNQSLVEALAPQYANHASYLHPDVRDKLAEISLSYLEANVGQRGRQKQTSDVLHLVEKLNPDRHLSQDQRAKLSGIAEDFYLQFARLGRPSTSSLLTLEALTTGDRGEQLYFETLACLTEPDAEAFYRAFPTNRLGIENWNDTDPFEDARGNAAKRLAAAYKDCNAWQ